MFDLLNYLNDLFADVWLFLCVADLSVAESYKYSLSQEAINKPSVSAVVSTEP